AARPVLVRPADAERKIGLAGGQHRVERLLEQPLSAEPVVVVAERIDAMLAGEVRLRDACARIGEIVVAELRRLVRLRVTGKDGSAAPNVGPLGKSLTPPGIVLRDTVELR